MIFKCLACETEGDFYDLEDPTNTNGACKVCGSKRWMEIQDEEPTKEWYKKALELEEGVDVAAGTLDPLKSLEKTLKKNYNKGEE